MTPPSIRSKLTTLMWISAIVISTSSCAGAAAPEKSSAARVATESGLHDVDRTERLAVEVPEGWRQLLDRRVGALYLADYYPVADVDKLINSDPAEASAAWADKLSVEILAVQPPPDPLVVVQSMTQSQIDACENPSDQGVFAGFENGYPTVVHILQCPSARATNRGLLTLVKVIQGDQALYTISRIWRVEATVLPPPEGEGATQPPPEVAVNPTDVAAWANTFKRFALCDPAAADHPCD